MPDKLFKGELVENRIVIWDIEDSKKIFGNGYFGKPLGVPKPKGTDFDAPLILDLIDGDIARVKGKESLRGHWLDLFFDKLVESLFLFILYYKVLLYHDLLTQILFSYNCKKEVSNCCCERQ